MEKHKAGKSFMVTSFTNCMSKEGTGINIYNWFPRIKDNTYKAAVENIRTLTEQGEDDKASLVKRNLPAICPCGLLPKGRKANAPLERNVIGWADYDRHDRAWAESARDSLKGTPGIIACYVTPRYGLHVFFKIPDDIEADDCTLYSQVVLNELDEKVGCPHDKQVEAENHLCTVGYDPDMFYVRPDQITDYPVEKVLLENQRELYQQLEDSAKNGTHPALKAEDYTTEEELNAAYVMLFRKEKNDFSKAQIDDMLMRYVGYNPLNHGMRNHNLIKLGQRAYYKRLSKNELDYLVEAVYGMIGCEEYTKKRIRVCLSWGYTHCDKQEILKTNANGTEAASQQNGNHEVSPLSPLSHPIEYFSQEPVKLADCQGNYDEVVEKNCPCLSAEVYDNLPQFFKDLVFENRNRRDMDMSLLGNIAAASGFTPKVTVTVRDQDYSTNLFFLGIAPAGSGKSIVGKSRLLFTYLKTKFTQENNARRRKYKEECDRWEIEQRNAIKQNRPKNYDLEPAPYVEKEILHPAQTSRASLIKGLVDNPNGISILTTEIDVLNESLNSDCGKHSAELRCLASNEPIESKYLKNPLTSEQDNPRGTLVAMGTPPQMVSFIGNTHDGMMSRCLIMLSRAFPEWISWADYDDKKSEEKREAYYQAAKEVVQIYEFLDRYPTHVTIPNELRKRCDKEFKFFTERLHDEGYDNLRSLVNRCPIHVSRICAILASIRKVKMGYTGIEIQATEEDMKVAYGIVVTLLRHSCLATTMLVEDGKKMNQIKNIFRQEDAFNSLSDEFTSVEALRVLMVELKYKQSTAYKIVDKWKQRGYIKNIRYQVYMKTGKIMSAS